MILSEDCRHKTFFLKALHIYETCTCYLCSWHYHTSFIQEWDNQPTELINAKHSADQRCVNGVKTLQTQDISAPLLMPKCQNSSAPVPKCLADTSALVPNCLDLQQIFFATVARREERFNITRYYY